MVHTYTYCVVVVAIKQHSGYFRWTSGCISSHHSLCLHHKVNQFKPVKSMNITIHHKWTRLFDDIMFYADK